MLKWRKGGEGMGRLLGQIWLAITAFVSMLVGHIIGWFRKPAPQPAGKPVSVVDQVALLSTPPSAIDDPLHSSLFTFPIVSQTQPDSRTWSLLNVLRPDEYHVPDADFLRVLSLEVGLRALGLSVSLPQNETFTVEIGPETRCPPYHPVTVSVQALMPLQSSVELSVPPEPMTRSEVSVANIGDPKAVTAEPPYDGAASAPSSRPNPVRRARS